MKNDKIFEINRKRFIGNIVFLEELGMWRWEDYKGKRKKVEKLKGKKKSGGPKE